MPPTCGKFDVLSRFLRGKWYIQGLWAPQLFVQNIFRRRQIRKWFGLRRLYCLLHSIQNEALREFIHNIYMLVFETYIHSGLLPKLVFLFKTKTCTLSQCMFTSHTREEPFLRMNGRKANTGIIWYSSILYHV